MIDAASALRARNLSRRHVKATIALGIFAGIAGGLALGAWGIARRTASVIRPVRRLPGLHDILTLRLPA